VFQGFAHIHGQPVGIIANNGVLFSQSALKATHFIELCEQRRVPLLFLVNVTGEPQGVRHLTSEFLCSCTVRAGYMVGSRAERAGIAKDGAKMVRAVATATVPKLSLVVGGSFGAGNYGMCGRAYGGRFMWMWPNARVGVMGSGQLESVMKSVSKCVTPVVVVRKRLYSHDCMHRDPAQHADLAAKIEEQSTATYSSARLWDDGIIKPEDTRDVLGLALGVVGRRPRREREDGEGRFGVFRM
jgi:3-methylcrotonyl-CoA carboxylase beta subunit